MEKLAAALVHEPARSESPERALGEALTTLGAADALRDACQSVNGVVRPTKVTDLDRVLFPDAQLGDVERSLVSDATRGLLLGLALARQANGGRSPQPVRGYLFFHNLQNLWACCDPACPEYSVVDQRARAAALPSHRPTVGALHTTHRLTCGCGARVLDLIACEVCGDVFLGGYKAVEDIDGRKIVLLTADQPDLEGIPDRVNFARQHDRYAVFWPLPHDAERSIQPQDPDWSQSGVTYRWVRGKLSKSTGRLVEGPEATTPAAEDEVPGWVYQVVGSAGSSKPALPGKCLRCDADYRRRKIFPSPLRNHRTGFQKAAQVLASALMRELGPTNGDARMSASRKLVIFSDSRQDAAKLAAGMELDHFRDVVRLALLQAFRRYWGDLEAFLRLFAMNPTSLAALETINPALWNEVRRPPVPEDADGQQRFQLATSPGIATEAFA